MLLPRAILSNWHGASFCPFDVQTELSGHWCRSAVALLNRGNLEVILARNKITTRVAV
jgi:hypothetical protein